MTSQAPIAYYLYTIGNAGGVVKTEQIVSTTLLEEGVEILKWRDLSSMLLHSATIHATSHSMVNSVRTQTSESSSTKLGNLF